MSSEKKRMMPVDVPQHMVKKLADLYKTTCITPSNQIAAHFTTFTGTPIMECERPKETIRLYFSPQQQEDLKKARARHDNVGTSALIRAIIESLKKNSS